MIKLKHAPVYLSLGLLAACGGGAEHTAETSQETAEVKPAADSTADVVVYNIPSPAETFALLKLTNAGFDKALMNPAEKAAKYSSSFSKAVNLGVYSADMSYCFMHKQNQDFNNYLKEIKTLNTALGIDGSYGESVAKRMQDNASNMDSLMQIASEAGLYADSYLKENKRVSTTAVIAFGAWIEGMHLMVNTASKKPGDLIHGLIADQKASVKNLGKMLEQFPEDADIKTLSGDLKEISAMYEALKPVEAKGKEANDKQLTSVGAHVTYSFTREELKTLTEKVEALRNKLTN
ncbi:MAG: hypothetical protein JST26_07565 [Bacteroidetes bacterium]|nr:hypothetical protein [Bacteroidota bacterium]